MKSFRALLAGLLLAVSGIANAGPVTLVDPNDANFSPIGVLASKPLFVALGTGTAVVGKVGIDQTTRGTTNAVDVTNRSVFYNDTSTPLGASASYTGGIHNTAMSTGVPGPYAYFNATAYSDVAGTLYVENTPNGSTWYPANPGTPGITVAAGQAVNVKVPVVINAYRVRFVNGAAAQTSFYLSSSFSGS